VHIIASIASNISVLLMSWHALFIIISIRRWLHYRIFRSLSIYPDLGIMIGVMEANYQLWLFKLTKPWTALRVNRFRYLHRLITRYDHYKCNYGHNTDDKENVWWWYHTCSLDLNIYWSGYR